MLAATAAVAVGTAAAEQYWDEHDEAGDEAVYQHGLSEAAAERTGDDSEEEHPTENAQPATRYGVEHHMVGEGRNTAQCGLTVCLVFELQYNPVRHRKTLTAQQTDSSLVSVSMCMTT